MTNTITGKTNLQKLTGRGPIQLLESPIPAAPAPPSQKASSLNISGTKRGQNNRKKNSEKEKKKKKNVVKT